MVCYHMGVAMPGSVRTVKGLSLQLGGGEQDRRPSY